jgi:hypothetical protein
MDFFTFHIIIYNFTYALFFRRGRCFSFESFRREKSYLEIQLRIFKMSIFASFCVTARLNQQENCIFKYKGLRNKKYILYGVVLYTWLKRFFVPIKKIINIKAYNANNFMNSKVIHSKVIT